ncbi:hypothetical protein BGW38_009982 [Lunasporangiospora selenospora]|uniref:TatD DNase family protein n=1 Tax=Lunasporangiospora selenospora TaxID=979761 RepID=A0A9P6G2U6_9FUNG|nr:hypothetical protein BGW38_009982 [Lunasporangiospora selenospora]
MCGQAGCGQQPPLQDQDSSVSSGSSQDVTFPAHLYAQLTDAHCHIQDDRENIRHLVQSWTTHSPNSPEAPPLLTGKLCLMGVLPSKDLGLGCNEASKNDEPVESLRLRKAPLSHGSTAMSLETPSVPEVEIVTVAWNDTDTMGDWNVVSKLAHDHPDRFVPCFGIHPWFTHKYMPLQEPTGQRIVLRRTPAQAQANGTDTSASSLQNQTQSSAPILSFSSDSPTKIEGPHVRHEDFLAMSKQLQESISIGSSGRVETDADGKDKARTTNDSSKDQLPAQERSELASAVSGQDQIQQIDHGQRQGSISKYDHYRSVLGVPNSAPENYLKLLAERLSEPRALEPALQELKRKLEEHPHAILGEIGLDRIARIPEPSITSTIASSSTADNVSSDSPKKTPSTTLALTSIQHQLDLVREQLKIAAALNRPVSFHCVQAYGHWHDFLIQEVKRWKQFEAEKEYRKHMEQIHGMGASIPSLPEGVPISRKSAAKLKREARDAEWDRHVASTLQESSDEESSYDDDGDIRASIGDTARPGSAVSGSSSTAAVTADPVNMTEAIGAPTLEFEAVLPPRLCMHSYGGSVDMIKAFTKMDYGPDIYFSFSILINGRLQGRKLSELILAVPEDRLLIESDHHSHGQVDQLLVQLVHKIASIRQWTIEETVEKTSRNWDRFVYG